MTIKEIREKIQQRREQLAFDKLSKADQEKLRAVGQDPYETDEIRAKRRAAEIERRKKNFDKLSEEARQALTALGVSPYQDGSEIIRRESGSFSVKK